MAPYHSSTQYFDLPINFDIVKALKLLDGQYKIKISIMADEDNEICWEWKIKLKFDAS